MKRFEYLVKPIHQLHKVEELNALGSEGWAFVTDVSHPIEGQLAIFMRETVGA